MLPDRYRNLPEIPPLARARPGCTITIQPAPCEPTGTRQRTAEVSFAREEDARTGYDSCAGNPDPGQLRDTERHRVTLDTAPEIVIANWADPADWVQRRIGTGLINDTFLLSGPGKHR